jgi:hypothetical protein
MSFLKTSGALSIFGLPERLYCETTNSCSRVKTYRKPGYQPKGETKMQFMVYDPNFNPEEAAPPTPELMEEMGRFIEEATKAGKVVATGALHPQGTRLRLSGGKFTVTDGPFIELKELLAGFAVIRVESLEEAIEWSKRFRKIVGDGESEIVQVFGPDDFGHP